MRMDQDWRFRPPWAGAWAGVVFCALFIAHLALTAAITGGQEFFTPPPPLSEDTFPCMDCHADQDSDPTPRSLDMHEEIQERFDHAGEQRWCLDCHNADDRDFLRLANGDLVDFDESYRLCGQCHGTIFRDWRAGVHGKRTGFWNGRKEYRLCVHCHDPHRPRFQPIAPMPPPRQPGSILRGSAPSTHNEEDAHE